MVRLDKYMPTSAKFTEEFILTKIKNELNQGRDSIMKWSYIDDSDFSQKEQPETINAQFIISE